MSRSEKLGVLDNLFNDYDDISNLKLSPTTSINHRNSDGNSNKILNFYKKKKFSFFNGKNELPNKNSKNTWSLKVPGTIRGSNTLISFKRTNSNNNGDNTLNQNISRKNSIRLFFKNLKEKRLSSEDEMLEKKKFDPWEKDSSFIKTSTENLIERNVKDLEHGLHPKEDHIPQETPTLVSAKLVNEPEASEINSREDFEESSESDSVMSDSLYQDNLSFDDRENGNNKISPVTPPDDVNQDRKIYRNNANLKDFESPYKFVFETPNRFSMDDSLRLDSRTMNNFTTIWNLLQVKDINNSQTFEEGIMISKLSEILVHLTKTKMNTINDDTSEYKKRIVALERELEYKKNEIFNLKKVNHKSVVFESNEKMNIKLDAVKNNNINDNNNVDCKVMSKQEILERQVNILSCFKEETLHFMFNISKIFQGLISDKNLKQYNIALKYLSFSLSLVSMSAPLLEHKTLEMKTHIANFYSKVVNTYLLDEILTKWPEQIRSNLFLTEQLYKLREQRQKKEPITATLTQELKNLRNNSIERKNRRVQKHGITSTNILPYY